MSSGEVLHDFRERRRQQARSGIRCQGQPQVVGIGGRLLPAQETLTDPILFQSPVFQVDPIDEILDFLKGPWLKLPEFYRQVPMHGHWIR